MKNYYRIIVDKKVFLLKSKDETTLVYLLFTWQV
jgi:hypothetical protein